MDLMTGVGIIFILLIVGISTFMYFFFPDSSTPSSTTQYSSPIGPTQTPPYQLESKSLLEVNN
jgi:hypothetical protein